MGPPLVSGLSAVPDPTPSRTPSRIRTPWWFRLIRALLNLSLLSLLGLQLFALFILSSDKHLRLPAFAQQALEKRLQEQGLSVRFSSLEVSPSGSLLVLDPKVYLTGTTEPVVEAEYFFAEPDWLTLLWSRRLSFSDVHFGNATFYCPPENSPTGARESIISQFGAGLTSQGNHWWRLAYLSGNFLNVQLRTEGNFVLPPDLAQSLAPRPAETPLPTPSALSLAERYRKWAREMLDLKPEFLLVKNPIVQVQVSGENSGVNKVGIFASADSARPPVPGLALEHPWIQLDASWDGSALRAQGPARAWAKSILYTQTENGSGPREVVTGGPAWARLQLAEGKTGIFSGRPMRATLYALSAQFGDFPLDSMEVDADLRSWPRFPFSTTLLHGKDWLKLSGQANFADQSDALVWLGGTFAARANTGIDTLLTATHAQLPARLSTLKFDESLGLEGTAVITANGELQSADLNSHTGGVHFERIDLDSVRARAHLSRDESGGLVVQVNRAVFDNRTWQVTGSYVQNLRTDDFVLHVNGDIEPRVLEPYFAEWWQEVWKFVVPGGQWPQADAVYAGNWQGPEEQDSIWAYAQIAHARARGVPMDDISVRVEQRPEILAVYDIRGQATGGGQLQGAMLWMMKPPYAHLYEERIIFDSTLPLAAVGAIGGPEAGRAVRPLESALPAAIHLDQRTGGLANPQPNVTATKVHAEFTSPLRAYQVPLDSAVVDVTAYDGFTDIPHLEFGLAGGHADANATIATMGDGDDELRFRVLLQNAKHPDFLSALEQFSVNENTPSEAPADNAKTEKNSGSMLGDSLHPGLFDLSLGGQLFTAQPASFTATGKARLHDAQLGQLQLLGGLSRLLADTKIPLGDFALNAASSDVQIAQQYLRLPNLVVTGPSARIVAAGTYNFSGRDLNFNALIFPVGEWDSGLAKAIAGIINPFSNTVTLKLHGKIDKPEWDLSMNPLRVFENRSVVGPAIPGIPAKADNSPELPALPPAPPLPDLPPSTGKK